MELLIFFFDKVVLGQDYITLYADLCTNIINSEEMPYFIIKKYDNNVILMSFRKIFLNKCQTHIHTKLSLESYSTELTDVELATKRKENFSAYISFIIELYNRRILKSSVIYSIVDILLRPQYDIPDLESLEQTCKLLSSIGRYLEIANQRSLDKLNDTCYTLSEISKNNNLPKKHKFMILDFLELRKNKWVPRKTKIVIIDTSYIKALIDNKVVVREKNILKMVSQTDEFQEKNEKVLIKRVTTDILQYPSLSISISQGKESTSTRSPRRRGRGRGSNSMVQLLTRSSDSINVGKTPNTS